MKSTTINTASSPSAPDQRLLGRSFDFVLRFKDIMWLAGASLNSLRIRQRSRKQLRTLSKQQLSDIGISYTAAKTEASKRFWQD